MAALFLWSAWVQWNDPDPWLWIGVYGLSGLFCVAAWRGKGARLPVLLLAAGSLLGASYLATRVLGQQGLFGSEEGREMMGLWLVGLWMLALEHQLRQASEVEGPEA